jgi:hypothetical protein
MSDNKIPGLPEIKFNKNGYEIRSDILGLAEKLVMKNTKPSFLVGKFHRIRMRKVRLLLR